MTIAQNQIPCDPDLADALNLLKKEILLGFNAHHVGTVQSFDSVRQVATATVNYKKTYFQLNAVSGLYNPVLVDYPLAVDCPAISLGGGAGAITFPVAQGDECLMLFNDRDLNTWFAGNPGAAVATGRLHAFSDAILLVGVRSLANVLKNYDTVRAVLRGGSAVIGANTSTNKILLSNATPTGSAGSYSYSTTLGTILQELINEIKNLVSATALITVTPGSLAGPSSPPLNAAAITAITATLTATATKLTGLLE